MLFKKLAAQLVLALFLGSVISAQAEEPAKEAEKKVSVPKDAETPDVVIAAWKKSYVPIRVSLELVSGKTQDSTCGGYVYDKKERLVVSSYHCLPPLIDLLRSGKHFSVDGAAAEVVAKLPEGDLVLLRVETLSNRTGETNTATAKIGDKAYVRSRLSHQIMESETPTNPYVLFFTSNWSSELTVSAVGGIGFYRPNLENGQVSERFTNTKLKMYMFEGTLESGMSGSPVFNENGEVIAIATSSGEGYSFATDISNVEQLLVRYKKASVKKRE